MISLNPTYTSAGSFSSGFSPLQMNSHINQQDRITNCTQTHFVTLAKPADNFAYGLGVGLRKLFIWGQGTATNAFHKFDRATQFPGAAAADVKKADINPKIAKKIEENRKAIVKNEGYINEFHKFFGDHEVWKKHWFAEVAENEQILARSRVAYTQNQASIVTLMGQINGLNNNTI